MNLTDIPETDLSYSDSPRLVRKAAIAPSGCAVTGDVDGPFVDTGRNWRYPYAEGGETPRIYLHVPYVEEIGRLVNMRSEGEVAELETELHEAKVELESLRIAFDALSGAQKEVAA